MAEHSGKPKRWKWREFIQTSILIILYGVTFAVFWLAPEPYQSQIWGGRIALGGTSAYLGMFVNSLLTMATPENRSAIKPGPASLYVALFAVLVIATGIYFAAPPVSVPFNLLGGFIISCPVLTLVAVLRNNPPKTEPSPKGPFPELFKPKAGLGSRIFNALLILSYAGLATAVVGVMIYIARSSGYSTLMSAQEIGWMIGPYIAAILICAGAGWLLFRPRRDSV